MKTKRQTNDEILAVLHQLGTELGREPTEADIAADARLPSVGTIKNRFGSKGKAMLAAGFAPPANRDRETLLDHLRSLRTQLERWPMREDVDAAFRAKTIPVGSKSYFTRIAASWPEIVEQAGGPPAPPPITSVILLEDIRRVALLQLPDKPAGRAPSQKHFKAGPPFKHSIQAYFDHLDGGVDEWVRAAGLEPHRLRSSDPKGDMLRDYKTLYDRLGRLPSTRDVDKADLDFSAIARYFRGLKGLRFALGLPISDSGGTRGKDLWFYTGRNAEVADRLFDLLLEGLIADYDFEVRWHATRRWSADFRVTRLDGQTLWVEFDGFDGCGRPSGDYTTASEKFAAYRDLDAPLYVISDSGYLPVFGIGTTLSDFVVMLRTERATAEFRRGPLVEMDAFGTQIRETARELNVPPLHLAWICCRGIVGGTPKVVPSLADLLRFKDANITDELLSVEAVTEALGGGITRRVLDTRIEDGILVPDHRKGRSSAYFFRSSLPRIRELLGEVLFDGDRSTLKSEEEAATTVGCSTSLLRRLVRTNGIVPSERRLVGGRILRYYAPELLTAIRNAHGAEDPPVDWLSVDGMVELTRSSRTSILRLVDGGAIAGRLCRPAGFAGSPSWFFPPDAVQAARAALPRIWSKVDGV